MIIPDSRLNSQMEVVKIDTMCVEKKVYDADDIQKLLGIGRSKAYAFLDEVYEKQKPFRVIKIGRLYRVPKETFDKWLNGES